MTTTTTALSLVEQYPPNKYNLLLPTTAAVDVTEWHRMAVSIVTIDPDPRKGDVYPVASRVKEGPDGKAIKEEGQTVYEDLFSLGRPATDRIGTAAGITYKELEHGGVVKATADYALCQAVAAIRRPDGTWAVTPPFSKEIDLKVIDMEAREKATNNLLFGLYGEGAKRAAQMYRGSWQPDPKYPKSQRFFIDPDHMARAIEDQIRPQLIQWRKNKLMRAETGARLRAIRGLTGIRLQYTAEELRLPFAVPRIDFTPDYKDPEVRRLMLTQGMAAAGSLYGRGSAAVSIPKDAEVINIRADDDIPDAEYEIRTDSAPIYPSQPAPANEAAPPTQEQSGLGAPVPVKPPVQTGPGESAGADQVPQTGGDTEQHTCTACQAIITEKVANYSVGKFGRKLCMKCQKGGGQ